MVRLPILAAGPRLKVVLLPEKMSPVLMVRSNLGDASAVKSSIGRRYQRLLYNEFLHLPFFLLDTAMRCVQTPKPMRLSSSSSKPRHWLQSGISASGSFDMRVLGAVVAPLAAPACVCREHIRCDLLTKICGTVFRFCGNATWCEDYKVNFSIPGLLEG